MVREIKSRGASLSAEVLVYIMRQAMSAPVQDTALANACAEALVDGKGKYGVQTIIRGVAWRYGLITPEHQDELVGICEEQIWKAVTGDRQRYYLWETRFGLALRASAESVAKSIRGRIEREMRALGTYPTLMSVDPDTLAQNADPTIVPADEGIDASRLWERLLQIIENMPEAVAKAARICWVERRPRTDAAKLLGVTARQVGYYLEDARDILRFDPMMAHCLEDYGFTTNDAQETEVNHELPEED